MKNTMTRRIILTLYSVCFCLVTQAQATFKMIDESIQQDLIEGFNNANPNQILNSIGEDVWLTVDDPMESGKYSKIQAERIITEFFVQYPPDSFRITNIREEGPPGFANLSGLYWHDGIGLFEPHAYIRAVVKLLDEKYRLIELYILYDTFWE